MEYKKQFQKIFAQAYKSVYARKWLCLYDECEKTAINSHLLQRNGILSTLAEDGHLYEIKPKDIFKQQDNLLSLDFKLTGLAKALSLPLFCNTHDTSTFKAIETEPINFGEYQTLLLLSLRAVCAEIRKKERNAHVHNTLINSPALQEAVSQNKEDIDSFFNGTLYGIKDMTKYKQLFEEELLVTNTTNKNFYFETFVYPLIKVYGSATFSPINYGSVIPKQADPFNAVFTHIVPYKNQLYIIVGYHKNYAGKWIENYTASWKELDQINLELKLTDLFARIESWGMSPSLFRSISPKTLNRFMVYWENNLTNLSEEQNIKLNLFGKKR